jgi:hypothetical protein
VSKLRSDYEQTVNETQSDPEVQFPEYVFNRYVLGRTLAKYNRDEHYVQAVSDLMSLLAHQVATDYRAEYEKMMEM